METLVAENGKPRYEAELIRAVLRAGADPLLHGPRRAAGAADELHHPLIFSNKRTRVVRHPRGVVGVIGPWNFPLLNNYGDCIGPLAAGNAVVLKPSDTTPLTSLRVGRALEAAAGSPTACWRSSPVAARRARRWPTAADMIFFTGSPAVGKQVAAAAAARLDPGGAGAGRQIGDDRAGRRRPAARRARRRLERVRRQRPGLHPHRARAGRGAGRRPAARAHGRGDRAPAPGASRARRRRRQ